jgi:hypothetical protein
MSREIEFKKEANMFGFNRRSLGAVVSTAVLFGLAGFSIGLLGSDLETYDGNRMTSLSYNPHHIPDHFNPRLISSNERADISYQIAQSSIGSMQELHSATFSGTKMVTHPTLDYTTGTSN